MNSDSHSNSPSSGDPREGLASASFLALVATQFFGAMNDNMFRWLVVPIGKHLVTEAYAATALSAGLACFVLPYILLAAPAGYLADRFSKRAVIIGCKVGELFIMVLGCIAIWYGNVYFLFAVVFVMGSQSALFGPSKFGSIPEILKPEKISAGNGVIGLTTVLAVVAGTVLGNYLYAWTGDDGRAQQWISAAALTGVSLIGLLTSLAIGRQPAADPQRRFPFNMVRQVTRDMVILASNRALLRVAFGTAFFWALASLAQLNVDLFGITELQLSQAGIGPLLAILSLGVGVGSVLAGLCSGGRVELGLVPLGALGMAVTSMLLFAPLHGMEIAYVWTCAWLCGLGLSAGFFDVPLQAFIQHRSPAKSRGSVIAASNFLTFGGMLGVSVAFYVMRQHFEFSARTIFLCSGLLTLLVAWYAFALIPQATIRMCVWLATHTLYRVRIRGRDNLPESGGALLVANHVTWLDAVLLVVASSRPIHFVISAELIRGSFTRWLARTMGAIPIGPGPKAVQAAVAAARRSLAAGELVCMFPEGEMTRSGQLQGFKRGVLEILEGAEVPTVPVYLDELWGSIFSFRGGRYFWKWPRKWPYPVSIWFGTPIRRVQRVQQLRQAVQDLGAEAVQQRNSRSVSLPRKFLRQCRRRLFSSKIADSSGLDLTGGNVLMRTLILRRLLLRQVLAADERFVGLLLPPSVGGVLANAAVALAGRVSANLNYTLSSEVTNQCIAAAGIRHVLTSRRVMEKLDLQMDAEIVFLEDFKEKVTWADKILAGIGAYVLPAVLLERWLGIHSVAADDVMTVIFTSGSTGQPKGVLLTQQNILSNADAIDQVIHLRSDDVFIGILPFFHSFGFTVTLWTVLAHDIKGAYHFSPLDPLQVGKLCRTHRGTALLATPTFLRTYLRRCSPEDLNSLEVVVVGAEKMPLELADAFEEKFGVRPVEGYGTTELSPLVSVNVPPSRSLSPGLDLKEGTVGRPVPGVSVRTVHRETGEDVASGTDGLLLVKGPNVMQGYLGQPDATAQVLRDGWYVTGDIAAIDDDGFIQITGRESRFSKIGGEMVPHLGVEEALQKIVPTPSDQIGLAVTAIPDARKGERLVVVHTAPIESPAEICRQLSAAGLPSLWIPSPEYFVQVDEIPVLGSGKLDLRRLRELALESAGR